MELEEVVSKDTKGNEVRVFAKKPGIKEYRDAQIVYNKAFREALESGAILKEKLNDHVREQGLWDDEKEKQYLNGIDKIRALEEKLSKGGIPLSQAKELSLDLRKTRSELNSLISQRTAYGNNSAEGQADGARFNSLTLSCILKSEHGPRVWETLDDYDRDSVEPWALDAVGKLANMIYGVDPDYEKNLPENKFLVKYKFADEKLNLVNKDGHPVDLDGRLIDDEGYFIKYLEDGTKVRITRDGKELDENGKVKVEFSPFLDDEGNPVE